jgi:hypothetical protein
MAHNQDYTTAELLPLKEVLVLEGSPGVKAVLLLVFGVLCCFVCPCFAPFCICFGLREKQYKIFFNDENNRVEVTSRGIIGNYGAPLHVVPYSSISFFDIYVDPNSKINNEPGAIMVLKQVNGTNIEISSTEAKSAIEARVERANTHLKSIKYV